MSIDATLLDAARRAGERAADAQCAADVAKAEYHRAIRRLQLAGATMREIAAVLGISHQRVQQIVDDSGGGRRWSRRRSGDGLLACSFCGSEQRRVKNLVAGPGLYICDRCIGTARRLVAGDHGGQSAASRLVALSPGPDGRCGFCGKPRSSVDTIVGLDDQPRVHPTSGKYRVTAICNECLDLCTEIVAKESDA